MLKRGTRALQLGQPLSFPDSGRFAHKNITFRRFHAPMTSLIEKWRRIHIPRSIDLLGTGH